MISVKLWQDWEKLLTKWLQTDKTSGVCNLCHHLKINYLLVLHIFPVLSQQLFKIIMHTLIRNTNYQSNFLKKITQHFILNIFLQHK